MAFSKSEKQVSALYTYLDRIASKMKSTMQLLSVEVVIIAWKPALHPLNPLPWKPTEAHCGQKPLYSQSRSTRPIFPRQEPYWTEGIAVSWDNYTLQFTTFLKSKPLLVVYFLEEYILPSGVYMYVKPLLLVYETSVVYMYMCNTTAGCENWFLGFL